MQIDQAVHRPRHGLVMLGFAAVACLGFVLKGSATSITLALAIFALFELRHAKVRETLGRLWAGYKHWMIALMILPVMIAIRELFVEFPRAKYVDSASRQILAIPLLLLAAQLPLAVIMKIRWAWLVALTLMLVAGLVFADPRIRTEFTNTIPFAAFALMFGVLLWIASEGLSARRRLLCWGGVMVGAIIVFLSASRGVWFAAPVAVYMGLKVRPGSEIRKLVFVTLISLAIAIAFYLLSPWFKGRVDASVTNFFAFLSGDKGSESIGQRLQLAFSSWYIFLDHPWFGVGRNILPALGDLFAKGLITASVADRADTHGEIFYNMASLGVFGVFATVWFYVGTTLPFWRARRSEDHRVAQVGRMGVACNAVFFVTGFTHITLGLAMYASIYAATQAILLAWLYKLQRENF